MSKNGRPLGCPDSKSVVRNIYVPISVSAYDVLREWADERDRTLSEIVSILVAERLAFLSLVDSEVI